MPRPKAVCSKDHMTRAVKVAREQDAIVRIDPDGVITIIPNKQSECGKEPIENDGDFEL